MRWILVWIMPQPGAGSLAQPFDQKSSMLPLCYGLPPPPRFPLNISHMIQMAEHFLELLGKHEIRVSRQVTLLVRESDPSQEPEERAGDVTTPPVHRHSEGEERQTMQWRLNTIQQTIIIIINSYITIDRSTTLKNPSRNKCEIYTHRYIHAGMPVQSDYWYSQCQK